MCYKDVSFWCPDTFHENDFYDIVRSFSGDLCEQVNLLDTFVQPKSGRVSKCYRITYRSMDRTLTNQEIDEVHEQLRLNLVDRLNVVLR